MSFVGGFINKKQVLLQCKHMHIKYDLDNLTNRELYRNNVDTNHLSFNIIPHIDYERSGHWFIFLKLIVLNCHLLNCTCLNTLCHCNFVTISPQPQIVVLGWKQNYIIG